MIGADMIDRIFALERIDPFGVLTESELLLVAQHARERSFEQGAEIIKAGDSCDVLFVRLSGEINAEGEPVPDVFDAPCVLFGLPARHNYTAGPAGAEVLCLAKPHLFTIARECPDFIVGLAETLERS